MKGIGRRHPGGSFVRSLGAIEPQPVTRVAPHVRDGINLERIMNGVVLSLLPVILFGLYNTGHQANRVMSEAGLLAAPGWRGHLLARLDFQYDPASILDSLCHGVFFYFPFFVVAVVVAWFWESLFALLRDRHPTGGFLLTALLFTLLLPPAAPLWQVAMGISFGVVVAKEIFGGTGKNFLNPAVAGIVYLHFAYPSTGETLWLGIAGYSGTRLFSDIHAAGMDVLSPAGITWWQTFLGVIPGPLGATSPLACALAAALLIGRRIASWQIMVGATGGLLGTVILFQFGPFEGGSVLAIPWYWHLTMGSFAFGIIFLATDPVTSAMTANGRWIYGVLVGSLVVLIRGANPAHPDGVILAVLLGNILAPLTDSFVIWMNVERRKRRVSR